MFYIHWNDAKIRQVIGRASRYESHISLPQDQQTVQVYKWLSVFPPYINYKTADEYLQDLSEKKDKTCIKKQERVKKIINNLGWASGLVSLLFLRCSVQCQHFLNGVRFYFFYLLFQLYWAFPFQN